MLNNFVKELLSYVTDSNHAYNNIVRRHLSNAISDILSHIGIKAIKKFCIYIFFDRNHKNVVFSENITTERYVTIILQNRFWDLSIDRENRGFEVTLDFDGKEKIYIPFSSIIMFSDPENNFCLDFRDLESYDEEHDDDERIINIDFRS